MNKGVISAIVDDEEMPFLENGKRVDLIINALGVINRLNPAQWFEQSITFICNSTVEKLKTIESREEREELLFDIVGTLSSKWCDHVKSEYYEMDDSAKDEFFNDVYTDGIYIHMQPMWEDEPMFNKIRRIYDKHDWIKPVDVYINKFGRKIKIMKPMIVGEVYVVKLKQTSKKNFSARSVGALNRKGMPDKSYKIKAHQDLHSSTPIRLGYQENFNSLIGVDSEDLATMHMYYRSSAMGRQWLGKRLMKSIKPLKKLKKNPKMKNRNAEILYAYLKFLGIRINFLDDIEDIKVYTDKVETFKLSNGETFTGTLDEYEDKELYNEIVRGYETEGCFIGTPEEYERRIQKDFELEKLKRDYEVYVEMELDD